MNGRAYRVPDVPTAVICLDGSDPAYIDDALARGLMPRLAAALEEGGSYAVGRAQLPSFTNPNNVSIVTGVSAKSHGIPGNHYLSPGGEEVQLTDSAFLRARTIHEVMAGAGVAVAVVTTKDKLRRLLSAGGVPCVSAEKAHELSVPELGVTAATDLVGRPSPSIYDPECSIYALELGLALGARLGAGLLYVSLTDYVQHAEAPGGPLADRFYARLDELFGAYLDAGFRVAMAADHGMNPKTTEDGEPDIRYLDDVLAAAGVEERHVVLPITDPYVVHHAALGSAAWVHVRESDVARAEEALQGLEGVEEVLRREQASGELELPPDRIGDLIVLAGARTALGKSASHHDLSALVGPLRSHGGRHEQAVPIIVSHPLEAAYAVRLASGVGNADVHDLVLNGLR